MAKPIQHRFENVRKIDRAVKSEHAGPALDRVDGAKDRVDGLIGFTRAAQFTKPDCLEAFRAFFEKRLSEVVNRRHNTARFAAGNTLTRTPC